MGVEELSASDKEVVGVLLKFVDKLPTKGLLGFIIRCIR